jgi:Ino eighty subunit 2
MADGEDVEEGSVLPTLPTMYRWLSTTKISGEDTVAERQMVMSFSVPISALPQNSALSPVQNMDLDGPAQNIQVKPLTPPQSCDIEGCAGRRKYRLVKDFHRGACGIDHLKQLEAQVAVA